MALEPILSISVEDASWTEAFPALSGLISSTTLAALEKARDPDGELKDYPLEISFLLASDGSVQKLNRDYRAKDKPTNVLSFAALESDTPLPPDGEPVVLGDVVFAFGTVKKEAEEQSKPFTDHFRHLIVHGVLHLLGFDHQNEEDAQEMEQLETEILKGMGIANPYDPT